MKQILKKIFAHKFISAFIILVLFIGGYFGYKALIKQGNNIKYVFASAEKGNLIVTVSGSGQVSALNQAEIRSKASGTLVFLGAVAGKEVQKGTLLAQVDPQDAQQSVRNAEIALEQAQLALNKMEGMSAEEGTIRGIKEKAQDEVQKAYEDGFNTVANIFLELPTIMSGIDNILFAYDFESNQQNISYYADAVRKYNETKVALYEKDTLEKYNAARASYDQNLQDYKSASRFSEKETIRNLIDETYQTVKTIAEAIKSANNLLQFYRDELTRRGFRVQALCETHLSNLSSYTGKTNNYLLNLLSTKNTIVNSEESLIETSFDIGDQKIKVEQAEENLREAKEKLNDYYIRAPFSGVVANVNVEKGDIVGSSATICSLITKQQIAEVSLNELDAAKVKLGQKATLTFDAIENLSITGEVIGVDTLGTLSQGVVSYTIKIGFDVQDERIKPGMTVSASIIVDVRQNALLVPNSAIKANNGAFYVQVVEGGNNLNTANASGLDVSNSLKMRTVEVGASNDTMTEVLSGLKEGEVIVTQTITGTSSSTASRQNQLRIPAIGGQGFRP